MSAKKITKSERLAKRRAKEALAKRDRRDPLSPLDVWAIHVHEAYQALIRQGFTKELAMDYITSTFHMPRIPDWTHENPDHQYEEDEDE
jgi:hypothetical protein